MKRNDFILRLICIMCATVLLCGMFAACGSAEKDPQPTEAPTQAPTEGPTEEPTGEPVEDPTGEPVEDPTGEPVEDPTGEPVEDPTGEPVEDPTTDDDSSIMDGDDHVGIPFG